MRDHVLVEGWEKVELGDDGSKRRKGTGGVLNIFETPRMFPSCLINDEDGNEGGNYGDGNDKVGGHDIIQKIGPVARLRHNMRWSKVSFLPKE